MELECKKLHARKFPLRSFVDFKFIATVFSCISYQSKRNFFHRKCLLCIYIRKLFLTYFSNDLWTLIVFLFFLWLVAMLIDLPSLTKKSFGYHFHSWMMAITWSILAQENLSSL
ncbi:hypothetical protein O6H91_15G048800 [Diphasiastrum complanatum]|uniref:Uncharacterized protein n=1 Tax=Diphasiastrum complanatum TaxID=34168 RepID=A0ACC2BI33_DIPCM|nr:hypothetical protein O6H91_15G048800 [Diphasiastrum complanatum]